MDLPAAPQVVHALAAFVRNRVGDLAQSLVPALAGGPDGDSRAARSGAPGASDLSPTDVEEIRRFATVVVGASAPFALTSYSRARLIRALYAAGLLTDGQVRAAAGVTSTSSTSAIEAALALDTSR